MWSEYQSLASLPAVLPWHKQGYLLLDGVTVEALQKKLYTWSDSPHVEPLFLTTRWAALNDLSPCLVSLKGIADEVLAKFIENAAQEWGYLLFSRSEESTLLAHLRWLMISRHPSSEEVLLRVADPAVVHALLGESIDGADQRLGPIECLITPDGARDCWYWHEPSDAAQANDYLRPHLLTETDICRLEGVAFRSNVLSLDLHMREYFPGYLADSNRQVRWEHLYDLATNAYQRGFSSERDITLYANIFGFLGDRALDRYPDIAALVNEKSSLSPSQRIEQAAQLAQERATVLKRNFV